MTQALTNVEALWALRDALLADQKERDAEGEVPIRVCMGASCIASGATGVRDVLTAELDRQGFGGRARMCEVGCLGPCHGGPVIVVGETYYEKVRAEDCRELVSEHLGKGRTLERLTHRRPDGRPIPKLDQMDFFRRQTKVVLGRCGRIDPQRIEEYIAADGYQALGRVLSQRDAEAVLQELRESGLRGRGGAGFPTWRKWDFTRRADGDEKYVACNADEGDPGAFMDRSVLEGDPHAVLEGMAVAAVTTGAKRGFVYVRAEYPLAVQRLRVAIDQARQYGLLGKNILGSGFDFDVEIRMGSGAFVCGEETALMTSIEGHRGEPRPRPPFPAQRGLWGKPTLLNNVETYANVGPILLNGGAWYAALGTEKSKGTKVFALAGTIKHAGLVEVPVGMPLGDLVYDIGGGTPSGKEFKAAQIGGPSGGCIPKQHLNI
jgi:NADH:ubiquinone oxidoreductase subunit F (NADH-binding)/(2Fe-2S) ferredoxin